MRGRRHRSMERCDTGALHGQLGGDAACNGIGGHRHRHCRFTRAPIAHRILLGSGAARGINRAPGADGTEVLSTELTRTRGGGPVFRLALDRQW